MSKTVLANVDGFTPVIDALVTELGLMTAVVFGRVWRYCQMEDQVCKASLEKIGESIGVDRVTVMRHIKQLCDGGYLKDLTPDLRNRPHIYVDTGKAGIKVSIYGVAESNTSPADVSESNTSVSENDSAVTQSNRGVSESHLNKVLKKEVKKQEERESVVSSKDIFLNFIQGYALSVFDEFQNWHAVRLRLEKDDIQITSAVALPRVIDPHNPLQITISGLSRKMYNQFTEAEVFESRYYKAFANLGLELTFTE